jgi:hypothetical protein
MKKCGKCGIEKENTEFFFKNKEKNTLHSICKECKRTLDRESYSQNKNDRKSKIRKNALKTNKEVKQFLLDYKKSCECSICGDKRWYVLDFHHIKDKRERISTLVKRGSMRLLKEELEKCIPLCANCHREVHYKEGTVAQ